MKYLSLFSGIGGFELGIEQAYEQNNKIESKEQSKECDLSDRQTEPNTTNSNGNRWGSSATCIGYSEIDKYAIQIFEKHYPNIKNYGDITTIQTEELPYFDLLVGGFPCQSFSIAGKRKGFDDTRGTLFFDIARILADKKPRHLVLENVKGLLSHDGGKTFTTIIGVLTDLGYLVEWQVLNSKNFGVPQNRERVFIIGHLRGTSRPKVFPITGSGKEAKNLVYIQKADREIARIYDPVGLSPTLHLKTGGWQEPKIQIRGGLQKNAAKMINQSPALTEVMGKYGGHTPIVNAIRRLTPTECERLQGFPDGWTEGISDTQRYKTLGNAVTVNVIKAIMEKL